MSIATKPETVTGRSWGPFGAGILAVLGCVLLTAGATVVFDEPDPEMIGELVGRVRNGVPEAHRASISARGEGVNRELRFGMTTDDGTHVRSRVIFVEGAGGRLHAVALQVGTNDEALAQSIVDSLTRDR